MSVNGLRHKIEGVKSALWRHHGTEFELGDCDDVLVCVEKLRAAWRRVAGFAVCECNGPAQRYRVVIDYQTLEQAQDAHRAMCEITEVLR
jgi:hypothetical protein